MTLHHETLGRGPRLVFVHGFTQTGRSWEPVAAAFTADHEVVLVDAPGHGGSSSIRADVPASARLLGDVGGRATYVGYSMGGRVCLNLAVERPELVERLVLIGATAGVVDPAERAARVAADEELAVSIERDGLDAFLERWLANPLFAGLTPEAAGLAERRRSSPAGLASSLRLAGTGTMEPLWDRLAAIRVPVLVLAGEQDTKFRALGERLVRAIGPNAAFRLVPGCGHAAHLEQPGAVIDLLRPFLSGLRGGLVAE